MVNHSLLYYFILFDSMFDPNWPFNNENTGK